MPLHLLQRIRRKKQKPPQEKKHHRDIAAESTRAALLGGDIRRMESVRENVDELRSAHLWRAMAAEFIGTLVLVLIGCGSCIGDETWGKLADPSNIQIAFAFGLAVATMVWSFGHVSGGHVNPAVTCGMFIARKISFARAALYVISQSSGAVAGAGILKGLTPHNTNETFGLTTVWKELTPGQGLGVEILITFVLVFCVFSSCDRNRADLTGSTPLSIGLAVTVCHLFAIKYTGSSMNPARSFGPAVITNRWEDHWVYWLGPILGGIIGGLLYELVFSEGASLSTVTSFFTSSTYGVEEYDVNPEIDDSEKRKEKMDAEVAV